MSSFSSSLHDEKTFYQAFIKDLEHCHRQVVIDSPFITTARMRTLSPVFHRLIERGVKIYVFTRNPKEHFDSYEQQSEAEIHNFEVLGVQVLICKGNHHRKLAMIDQDILWEGSLNILSQTNSREIMRRIDSPELTMEMYNFLNYKKFL